MGEAWVFHNRHIAATPPSEGRIVQYILDGLWDCDKTYEFEVSGRGDGINYDGRSYGDTTITAPTHSYCPSSMGHQADNRVEWYEDRTTFPAVDPLPPLPDNMENPYDVFDTNIASGARAWNGIHGVSVSKCSKKQGCEITAEITSNIHKCGGAAACFDRRFETFTGTYGRSWPKRRHITGKTVYFILDSNSVGRHNGKDVYWTTNSSLTHMPVEGVENTIYLYIGAVAVHEFGHTVGLEHITNNTIRGESVMGFPRFNHTPTAVDRKHVRAIYHGHSSH